MSEPGAGRLFLVVGLPGAGKTTLARALAERHAAVRLSPDDWLSDLGLNLFDEALRAAAEARLVALADELLRLGNRVILEFGSWARSERDYLLAVGRGAGAAVELHVLDPPADELWRRVSVRNAEPGEISIDRATLESWREYWEPPGAAELATYDPPAD